ncbi:hypothetical protein VIGAN_02199000 [Vigna angularis var. angularis]|uniref:Uncharacterized protein n=1 Tax=Vigna angularis var. angularis TaxID=157739 RepID=A0A0S3RF27_PHAAN|nr:hypothetical protein VIGAN_02199000 [Vigna angularis var. angularis]
MFLHPVRSPCAHEEGVHDGRKVMRGAHGEPQHVKEVLGEITRHDINTSWHMGNIHIPRSSSFEERAAHVQLKEAHGPQWKRCFNSKIHATTSSKHLMG